MQTDLSELQRGFLKDNIAPPLTTAPSGAPPTWKADVGAGLVVFLVALPLCLGIALASGAPLFSGIIAGVIGGVVVGLISGSHVSVSGPAAGLAVIVAGAISSLGLPKFQLALCIAGVMQVLFAKIRFGILANFVPHAVIKGMLAGIGVVIILKQIPHALGRDSDFEGDFAFLTAGGNTTLTDLAESIATMFPGALLISSVSLALILLWDQPFMAKMRFTKAVPGALVAVVVGLSINILLRTMNHPWAIIDPSHLVSLPTVTSAKEFGSLFSWPDFTAIQSQQVWIVAATLAVVASLESLLSLDAADKLDVQRRLSSPDRELVAQGVGNLACGLVGGIPVTSVVVRSSANAYAGGKTKFSTIFHGLLLAIAVLLIPAILNQVPLACLAAVLIVVGYKLTKPVIFKTLWSEGGGQFYPFLLTMLGVIFLDILKGVIFGILVGLVYVLQSNRHRALTVVNDGEDNYLIRFNKDITFLNKTELKDVLIDLPDKCHVLIQGRNAMVIDHDIIEVIEDFVANGDNRGIVVELEDVKVKKLLKPSSAERAKLARRARL